MKELIEMDSETIENLQKHSYKFYKIMKYLNLFVNIFED